MIRLERTKLLIERTGAEDVVIDPRYVLGTPFKLKIEAGKGRIQVFYNDVQIMGWPRSVSGCYFKIGCYTQSNLAKGDSSTSYGEVIVRELSVQR